MEGNRRQVQGSLSLYGESASASCRAKRMSGWSAARVFCVVLRSGRAQQHAVPRLGAPRRERPGPCTQLSTCSRQFEACTVRVLNPRSILTGAAALPLHTVNLRLFWEIRGLCRHERHTADE